VDAVLGTQRVHEEEWYELFSEMPAFTYSLEVINPKLLLLTLKPRVE